MRYICLIFSLQLFWFSVKWSNKCVLVQSMWFVFFQNEKRFISHNTQQWGESERQKRYICWSTISFITLNLMMTYNCSFLSVGMTWQNKSEDTRCQRHVPAFVSIESQTQCIPESYSNMMTTNINESGFNVQSHMQVHCVNKRRPLSWFFTPQVHGTIVAYHSNGFEIG